MRLTMGKFSVARATCVACFVFACGFAAAQEVASANEPGDDSAPILTRSTAADEGLIRNVLNEDKGTQTQGSGAAGTPAPESQGSVLKRLGHFYAADWTGKLPVSATPERRALNAPLE